MLYTKSAVKRILGITTNPQIKIEVWVNVVWVHVAGKRPTFISKKSFKVDFVEFRKNGAKTLTTFIVGANAIVKNNVDKTSYIVGLSHLYPNCSCEDYLQQRKQIPSIHGNACKHIYAALGQLGFASLEDYIKYNQFGFISNAA